MISADLETWQTGECMLGDNNGHEVYSRGSKGNRLFHLLFLGMNSCLSAAGATIFRLKHNLNSAACSAQIPKAPSSAIRSEFCPSELPTGDFVGLVSGPSATVLF